MEQVGISELRRDLEGYLDRVEADRVELVVTRQDRSDLVILPLAELESLRETLHLLGPPANARRLLDGIGELDAGRGREHEPLDP